MNSDLYEKRNKKEKKEKKMHIQMNIPVWQINFCARCSEKHIIVKLCMLQFVVRLY